MRTTLSYLFLFLLLSCQSDEADKPEIKTNSATSIGINRAVLQGEVKEVGPLKPIQYGFLWSAQPGVTVLSAQNRKVVGETSATGTLFSIEIQELNADTEYFVRAFASNASFTSISYGEEVSFRTAQPSQYIRTLPAENVTSSSALLKGQVIDLHELEKITYSFAWSTSPFNSIFNAQVIVVGDSDEALYYETPLPGLQPGTTYYYKAFLSDENSTLIVSGQQLSFTTAN